MLLVTPILTFPIKGEGTLETVFESGLSHLRGTAPIELSAKMGNLNADGRGSCLRRNDGFPRSSNAIVLISYRSPAVGEGTLETVSKLRYWSPPS